MSLTPPRKISLTRIVPILLIPAACADSSPSFDWETESAPIELRRPPRTAPPGVVLASTVWASPDVITEDDPTALDSVTYLGRGTRPFYDLGESRWRQDMELFLFEAHFTRGAAMVIEAHEAYGVVDSARIFVEMFIPPMGPLPRFLIDHGPEVELMPQPAQLLESRGPFGAGGLGCQKSYHWRGDVRGNWREPYMEEVAMHEGSHAILEGCCHGVCSDLGGMDSEEWRAAQVADGVFITEYARNHPNREDMAETLWAWFISRCVPDRLHPQYKERIDEGIPHRLTYFDNLNLDMRPWRC